MPILVTPPTPACSSSDLLEWNPTMDFVLLAERPDQLETVARWHHEAWGRPAGVGFDATLEKVRVCAGRDPLPSMILGLSGEGSVVGTVTLSRWELDIDPSFEFWLGGLYVDEARRGDGIGRALVSEGIRRAGALELSILHLQTEELGGGLYRKVGFRPVEVRHLDGYRALIMRLIVAEARGVAAVTSPSS